MKNRPAIKILIPYLAGIILADKFNVNITFLWIMSALCLFSIFYAYKERWFTFSSVLLAVCLLFLGFLRYEISITPPHNIDKVLYQQVRVYGTVLENQKERAGLPNLIKRSGGSSLIIDGEAYIISQPSVNMQGKIYIRSWEDDSFPDTYGYGDIVCLDGKLTKPQPARNPGAFNYQKYMYRQGIFAIMTVNKVSDVYKLGTGGVFFRRWIRYLREKIEDVIIDITADSDSAAILKGVVLGERNEMSNELYQKFRKTSTTHIIVVSGVNFTILAEWTSLVFIFLIIKPIRSLKRNNTFFEGEIIYFLPVFLVTIVYLFMAGTGYNVIRAFVFIFLNRFLFFSYRDKDSFNILSIAVLVIIIPFPGAFWDAGFQLSFAAVAGITYFTPYWERLFKNIKTVKIHQRLAYLVCELFALSISAQFGASLIIANIFGTFSISGIFVNPIIAPLVTAITPLGFLSCLIGLVYMPIANFLGWVDNIIISLLKFVISWFAEAFPLIPVRGFSFIYIIFCISIVLIFLNMFSCIRQRALFNIDLEFLNYLNTREIHDNLKSEFKHKGLSLSQNAKTIIKKADEKWLIMDNLSDDWRNYRQTYLIKKENSKLNIYKKDQMLLISCLAIVSICVWFEAMMYDGYVTRVTYLNVGEADSAFVEFPNNYNILIDGGSNKSGFDYGERVVGPFLRRQGIYNLDLLVGTHPDNDHVGGLTYLVDNPEIDFSINKVITGSYGITSPTFNELIKRLDNKNIEYFDAKPEVIHDNGDIKIEVLSDQYQGVLKNEDLRTNNNSVVLKLTYKEASFLFTGDITKDAEQQLINSGRNIKATVLKVAHHGSASSSGAEFIRAVQPSVAVISVGYRNFYHHPSPYVVARYDRSGVKVYRTDKQGAVTIITDGRYGWIKTMSQ